MVVGFSIILKIKKIVIFMYVEQVAEGMWIMLAFWSVRRIDFLTKNVGGNMHVAEQNYGMHYGSKLLLGRMLS